MRIVLTGLVLLSFAMAGCVNGDGVNTTSTTRDAVIVYQGDEEGTVSAEAFQCAEDAYFQLQYNLDAGKVRAEVLDGAGVTVWSKTYATASAASDTRELTGAPGDWTLQIERISEDGSFEGSLSSRITCR